MAAKFEKLGEGDYQLDVQGYVCPHPQIYAKKALEKLKPGETLRLVFDNPSSGESISAMCQTQGDAIVEQARDSGNTMRWTIRKH
ncbi:MAG: sulfurtransferase TusA family protein [Burkholderiales bacterium]